MPAPTQKTALSERLVHLENENQTLRLELAALRKQLGNPASSKSESEQLRTVTTRLQLEITEREVMEQAVWEYMSLFLAFMNNSPAIAFIKDEEGRYIYLNDSGEAYLKEVNQKKEAPDSFVGKTDFDIWPEEVARQYRKNDLKALEADCTIEVLESDRHPQGAHQWLAYRFPLKNLIGRRLLGGISVDLTERKQMEEQLKASLQEKEVLLQEVHHRVKNNMQVISTLLDLQTQYIRDPKDLALFEESQHRIFAMSLVHEHLYRSKDLSKVNCKAFILELAHYLLDSYQILAKRIHLDIQTEEILLEVNKAIPLGLLLNELVSNALKYAFPNRKEGSITIRFFAETPQEITLLVRDNGVGLPKGIDFQKMESLGMKLIMTLVQQLKGELVLRQETGTEFKILFSRDELDKPQSRALGSTQS